MPAGSIFGEFEDQRALQLALELSMLGLSSNNNGNSSSASSITSDTNGGNNLIGSSWMNPTSSTSMTNTSPQLTSHLLNSSDDELQGYQSHHILGGGPLFSSPSAHLLTPEELRAFILPKKSQNMTECVPVPSSEHVAEIVGRQGT